MVESPAVAASQASLSFLSLSLVAALSVGRSQGPGPAIGLSQGSVPGSGCQVSAPVLGWF